MTAVEETPVEQEALTHSEYTVHLQFYHAKAPLRRIKVELKVAGIDYKLTDIERDVDNPNSGHPVALTFRSKWSQKLYGKLEDWRRDKFEVTDREVDGPAPAKVKITATISETSEPHFQPELVTGVWPEDQTDLIGVGGMAELEVLYQSTKYYTGQRIMVKWSAVGPGNLTKHRIDDNEEEKDAKKAAVVLKALEMTWPLSVYGPFSHYKLRRYSYAVDRLDIGPWITVPDRK